MIPLIEPFNCTSCGLCCRGLDKVIRGAIVQVESGSTDPEMIAMTKFPYPLRPDGSCSKLVDNKCSVYATRPDVCRVGVSWRKFHSERHSLDYHYRMNEAICKQKQDEEAAKTISP